MATSWMLTVALLACCLGVALGSSYCTFRNGFTRYYRYCNYGCCSSDCCDGSVALAVWVIIVIVVVVILVISGIITLICCCIRRRGSRGTVMQPMPMQSGVTVVNAQQGQTAYPAAAGWQQPYTTTPGWQQPQAATAGWQQPGYGQPKGNYAYAPPSYEASAGHPQPHAYGENPAFTPDSQGK